MDCGSDAGRTKAGWCWSWLLLSNAAAGWCCWLLLLIAAVDCCCWLLLLIAAVAGCCCWLLLLVVVAGCCCWLLLLVAAAGCCCWLLLLIVAAGSCCWLLLLVAAADCCCWLLLLIAQKVFEYFQNTVDDLRLRQFCRRKSLWIFSEYSWRFAAKTNLQAKKSLNIFGLLLKGLWIFPEYGWEEGGREFRLGEVGSWLQPVNEYYGRALGIYTRSFQDGRRLSESQSNHLTRIGESRKVGSVGLATKTSLKLS